MTKLTHLNDHGQAHMVDIASKVDSDRTAIATGSISMKKETLDDPLIEHPKQGCLSAELQGLWVQKKLRFFRSTTPLVKVAINLSINDNFLGWMLKRQLELLARQAWKWRL